MYTIRKQEKRAKRATWKTPHGTIETPVFMNVGTLGAVKGGISTLDLKQIKTQVYLANTYHLHLRPGDELVKQLGGIRKMIMWDQPLLTDSGGFQVFSLASLRKVKEEGVYFSSHIDGKKIFMSPEISMRIQSNLASTIAMAFDECIALPAEKAYIQQSVDRTSRWLERSIQSLDKYKKEEDCLNPKQFLFGINQGGIDLDIRIAHAKTISTMDCAGYAIGGLSVGESHEEMYRVLEETVPFLPKDKPTYLMGVGTPENILEAVERGVDFFDCVLPCRNGRHGQVFTSKGKFNLHKKEYALDEGPIDELCNCFVCKTYSRAYLRHLFKAKEVLASRLAAIHNLYFYNHLMEEIRNALDEGCFAEYKKAKLDDFRSLE